MSIVKREDEENTWVDDITGDEYWVDGEDTETAIDPNRVYMMNATAISEDEWCLKTQRIRRLANTAWADEASRYHREDAPAFVQNTTLNGKVSYHFDHGRAHRDVGPAEYNADGSFFKYFRNGQLHRDDGPAQKDSNGLHFVRNGTYDRTDGPCIVSPDGLGKMWALKGKSLAEADFNELSPDAGLDRKQLDDGTVAFFKKGTQELHRTTGPAITYPYGKTAYYRNNLLHRAGDLPAVEDLANNGFEFRVDGLQHRDPELGPAKQYLSEDDGVLVQEFWQKGLMGTTEFPARIYIDPETDIQMGYEFWLEGHRHRTGGPAVDRIIDGEDFTQYWVLGQEFTKAEFDSGSVRVKDGNTVRWIATGENRESESAVLLHRVGGPAFEDQHKVEFRLYGQLHNAGGPAVIYKDDGAEEYWLYDKSLTKEEWTAQAQWLGPEEVPVSLVPEKVFEAGLEAEDGWTYFFDSENGNILRSNGNPESVELVLKTDVVAEHGALYYIDGEGDVAMVRTANYGKIPAVPDDIELDIQVVEETPTVVPVQAAKPAASASENWGLVGGGAVMALGLLAGLSRAKKKATKSTTQTTVPAVQAAVVPVTEPVRMKR